MYIPSYTLAVRKDKAIQGQFRTVRGDSDYTYLREQFSSSTISEWLQDHSFQGGISLLILALSHWLIGLESVLRTWTIKKKKKNPVVDSRGMQRINCHVRLHFLHSYTGLIFRLYPCFWGKQCINMPLPFFKWQGGWSLLMNPRRTSDPSSPTHASWGKSLKWKNPPVRS